MLGKLTRREKEVLECLASGFSNCEIACELNISIKTVKNHLINIYRKLDVNSDRQAIAIFYKSIFGGVKNERY